MPVCVPVRRRRSVPERRGRVFFNAERSGIGWGNLMQNLLGTFLVALLLDRTPVLVNMEARFLGLFEVVEPYAITLDTMPNDTLTLNVSTLPQILAEPPSPSSDLDGTWLSRKLVTAEVAELTSALKPYGRHSPLARF